MTLENEPPKRAWRAKTAAFAHGAWARMRQAGAAVGRWPWKKIGIGAGGTFGVLVLTLVLFVSFADWNAWRGTIGRVASGIVGRPIIIAGDLDVRPWSLAPRIIVKDLRIGDPYWGERANIAWAEDDVPFATVANAETRVELLSIFTGITLRSLELHGAQVNLARDENGRANWSSRAEPQAQQRPLKLPVIRSFIISDSKLALNDMRRNMRLESTLSSNETLENSDRPAFRLVGEGTLNRRPFDLVMTGGPLLNVRRDRPYEFHADLKAGATHILLGGVLNKPFDFAAWRANFRATGNDLADLYYIIGLSLPNTPPYRLNGVLTRERTQYKINDVTGRVGDSDLNGDLSVLTNRERPFVEASFSSRSLDFDDLAAVLGAPPATDETASPEQRAEAARLAAEGRILPDASLDLKRVRNMDAHLVYRARRIVDAPAGVRAGMLDLTLDEGVLTMNPVRFVLAQGRIGGTVRIDARQDTPDVNMDIRLAGARLESLIPVENAVSGPLAGRAVLHGRGLTVRQAAATANGSISVVAPGGTVRAALAELTGINVVRGLGLLLNEDQEQTALRCGVADFQVRSGQATRRIFIFDTEDVLIVGEGGINLDNETLDLRLQGQPKEARLIRLMAPITVTGRLRSPQIGIEAGSAAGQAGLAGILGTVLTPLAAILPFVDLGLAEDANCGQLLQQARGARPQNAQNAPPPAERRG